MPYKWDHMRPIIEELYLGKQMTLDEVMEYLKKHYHFKPCTRAYRDHLKKWGMVKYKKREGQDIHGGQDSPGYRSPKYEHSEAGSEEWPSSQSYSLSCRTYEAWQHIATPDHGQYQQSFYHGEHQPSMGQPLTGNVNVACGDPCVYSYGTGHSYYSSGRSTGTSPPQFQYTYPSKVERSALQQGE